MNNDSYEDMTLVKKILELSPSREIAYEEGCAIKCLFEINDENATLKLSQAIWLLQEKLHRLLRIDLEKEFDKGKSTIDGKSKETMHKYAKDKPLDKELFENPDYADIEYQESSKASSTIESNEFLGTRGRITIKEA